MRLTHTPHARSSGAHLRVFKLGTLCVVLLMAAAAQPVRAEPAPATASKSARGNADPQQLAIARALFEEGLRHVDAGRWALAADRFSRVLALRYSAVAAYNLALARARLGSSVLALEALRELLTQPGLEPTVRDAALALQKEQQANVGWLTVRVRGACPGCRVELDGKEVPTAALGVAVPIDPGRHALGLLRETESVASTTLLVSAGARIEGDLHVPVAPAVAASTVVEPEPDEPVPAAALAPTKVEDKKQAKGSLLSSPWFWGGVGVLAAGVVTLGVVLAGNSSHEAAAVPGNFSPGVISGEVKP